MGRVTIRVDWRDSRETCLGRFRVFSVFRGFPAWVKFGYGGSLDALNPSEIDW